jgi:hypothetical protein
VHVASGKKACRKANSQSVLRLGAILNVLTLGELRKGVEAKRCSDSMTAARLGGWVDGFETTFAAGSAVLPVGAAAARLWGELSAGRYLLAIDTLILATAITRALR